MNENELAELLKYSNSKELYIIDFNNLLKLLFCPFKVRVKHDIGGLKSNQIVWVDEIKITDKLTTVYVVQGQAYYYNHFEILDK